MRCEHCGQNEATFHYQRNVNGYTSEAHLCPSCAAALGYQTNWEGFGGFDSVFSIFPSMMGGGWFGEPQLTPTAQNTLQLSPAAGGAVYETESLLDEEEGEALRRERARNALTVRLNNAVAEENYEEAARARDELKQLDP